MTDQEPERYLASPPKHLFQKGFHFWGELKYMVLSLFQIFKFALLPFQHKLNKPADPPDPDPYTLDEATIERCETLYEAVETSREQLEVKARATFTMIAFLTPLLASAIVFVLQHTEDSDRALVWLFLPALLLLLLAFGSVTRAGNVRPREKPFIEVFIDRTKRTFLPRDDARYVQCLMYCVFSNSTSNDHVAQLVKGGQVLTTLAVVLFACGSVPFALKLKATTPKTHVEDAVQIEDHASNEITQAIQHVSDTVTQLQASVDRAQRQDDLLRRVEALERAAKQAKGTRPPRGSLRHPQGHREDS